MPRPNTDLIHPDLIDALAGHLAARMHETIGVQVRSQAANDSYGTPTSSYAAAVNYAGYFEQVDASEITADRDLRITDARVYLPTTAVIGPLDRVVARSQTYEVIGVPDRRQIRGGELYVVAHIRVAED